MRNMATELPQVVPKACGKSLCEISKSKPLQADGSLPLCEEIDLAMEYHINSGYSEKKAIKETASEVRDIWKRTTQIQVSEDKSIIRKIDKVRAARKRTVMENSSRTNKKRFANVKGEGSQEKGKQSEGVKVDTC